ncbi:MAG: hypothetical protein MI784_16170 [Cytophagales bacterium]|nr:hypothetical protein [Cytophagales bacterium]
MEKLKLNEFQNVLQDVRSAYRLLYLYQRRIMDTINFIGNQYSYSVQEGWCKFSNRTPSPKSAGIINKWSWDWLNMYLYEFYFGSRKIKEDKLYFSILIQSDTGMWDENSGNKLNVASFGNVAEAKSRLIFIVGKNGFDRPVEDLLKNKLDKTHFEFSDENGEIKRYARAYDLENFLNEDTTMKIVKEFNKHCKDKGICDFLEEG